ncbi:solute carrier family 2, facilitated glucose transporter member 3-like [Babylonia areolata]|uniref:solute carrier family 2, facilitated glucose transporter member 3-like n=1 Tax=Babylonia areolata TaxID=304850 RepID=UPI003FD19518
MAEESTPLLSVNNNSSASIGVYRGDSSGSIGAYTGSSEIDHVGEVHTTRRPGLTCHLVFAVAACILGSSFQVGYNTGVVNSPADVIKEFYNRTYEDRNGEPMPKSLMTMLWAITVSCYAAGGMIGGLSAGFWANRYGRRGALLWNNIVAVVASGLMGFSKMSKSYEMLIVGRVISGINAGVNSGVAPLYLSEISPVSLRGLCGTFNQIAICFGVVIAEVMGLDLLLGTETLWPIAVGFPIVPVIFQLLTLLPCCPESPRFMLVVCNEDDEAEKGLVWLRGTEDVGEELEEMRREAAELRNAVQFSVKDLFRNPELRWPLTISVVLMMAQQFSGINAVIYYSTTVFMGAGLTKQISQYATAGTGGVNVLWTFVSAVLMDKLGRRTLMIVGLGGMLVFSVVLTISLVFQASNPWLSYLCIAAVVLYIVAFATGPGAIPWFYVAELFAQGPRSAAVSVSVLINWLSNFTVGLVFPVLQESIQEYSFVPFVVMLLASLVFVIIFAPETKGKRIEDITLLFKSPDEESESSLQPDQNYRRLDSEKSLPRVGNVQES